MSVTGQESPSDKFLFLALFQKLASNSWASITRSRASQFILLDEQIAKDGPTVLRACCRLGAEGAISERVDSTYRSAQTEPVNAGGRSVDVVGIEIATGELALQG